MTELPTSTAGADDRRRKRARVLDLLAPRGAAGVLLTSPAALAWYLDGARVDVGAGGAPVLAVRVHAEGDTVFCLANEVDRLRAEELPAGIEVRALPWHTDLSSHDVGADVLAESALAVELRAARAALLPGELGRYRALGAVAAQAVTAVLAAARPEHTERAVAAELAARLVAAGADPTVLLVAGHDRRLLRHPVPTDAALGGRAMVVVCARRHGLIANLTRWVRFGPDHPDGPGGVSAVLRVEADAFAATVPGRRLSDVLAAIAAAYPRHGLAGDEWCRHHQGGPTGYAGRDPRATPSVPDRVVAGGAFAWNPTAPGQKVEDTVVLGPSGPTDLEVLTVDPNWPTVLVDGRPRPLELQP